MTQERFWRCVPCDAVIRLTEGEQTVADAPLYPLWSAALRDEQSRFLDDHRSHLIELLVQSSLTVVTSGPLWDPATTVWWEVSNAARRFVIEGRREACLSGSPTLDEAMTYRCIQGCLRALGETVSLSAEEVAAAIDTAIFPHVLPHSRLKTLTSAAVRAAAELAADDLDIVHSAPTDPSVQMARLPPAAFERLLDRLRPLLARWEHDRVANRLRGLHAADGLLVTLCRRYEVAPDQP